VTLPHSKLAESLLQRESVFHEVQGSEIGIRQRRATICGGLSRRNSKTHAGRSLKPPRTT
jgi:hypothetical protein